MNAEAAGDFADRRAIAPAADLLADEPVHFLLPLGKLVKQSHRSPSWLVRWQM